LANEPRKCLSAGRRRSGVKERGGNGGEGVLKHRLIALAIVAIVASGCAAARSFHRGQVAAQSGDWDAAVAQYTKAVQEDPDKAEYKIALERAQQNAAHAHIARARELEAKDQLDAALIEYRRAMDLDATNRLAAARAAELERTIRTRLEASRPRPEIEKLRAQARLQGPPVLDPVRVPLTIKFDNASLKDILNSIGSLSGINIQFDQGFPDRGYTVQLDGVTLEQALQQIMTANQLFYKVINPRTILVIQDTPAKHQQFDELAVRVFYVSHADVTELAQVINTIMRVPTMAIVPQLLPNKTANTITVRATPAVLDVIERIIRSNDKPRAEVVIDVQILEVNRSRTRELGLNLSNYGLGLTFSPEVNPGTAAPPPFNLNTISQGISTADFYLTVPTAAVRFLESDTRTKQIAKPQLRGAEGQEMTLNLGEEVPVLSTVFGAAVPGGFASVPQSSFSYRPVGVNLAINPRVTFDGEIVLDLSVESSTLGASVSVAGQDVPSFGTRKVKTRLRLREGESNLLAGLLKDDQRKILTGFPGIMKLPVLRSLFGQTTSEVAQTDIVMLLTPHIVRTHELTVEDLSPIYIGTQQNVGLGGPPPLIAPLPTDVMPVSPAPTTTPTGTTPIPGAPAPGVPGPPVAAPPGVPNTNPPPPPGTSPVPTLVTPPGATTNPPTGVTPTNPPVTNPPATNPPATTPVNPPPATNPPATTPANPPTTAPATGVAQVVLSMPGTEFRIAGGPYTAPLSVNNVSRLSVITLTVTFNPNVLRVRTVNEGQFLSQGGSKAGFTPRIDAAAGRVDIAINRIGDQTGVSGTGLLASLVFDAVGPGGTLVQVSGVASAPDGSPIPLQFSPVAVTVR
jgi:general secretion pathway protein D